VSPLTTNRGGGGVQAATSSKSKSRSRPLGRTKTPTAEEVAGSVSVRKPRARGRKSDGAGFALSPRVREDGGGYLPPMVSRAQNFEDVILRRVLRDVEVGFYVDIGAWDPLQDSVTAWFYQCGWRGVNVEPHPDYFSRVQRARPRDINLACLVGSDARQRSFVVLDGTGLSSGAVGAARFLAEQGLGVPEAVTVPEVTLDQLLSLAGDKTVDFLKVDAEGMESEILNSASLRQVRPRIIVVEATHPNTQLPCHQAWEPQLLAKNYELALFDGLNRFYVRAEDGWRKPIFAVPPCVFDNFQAATRASQQQEIVKSLARAERSLTVTLERAEGLERQLQLALDRIDVLEIRPAARLRARRRRRRA